MMRRFRQFPQIGGKALPYDKELEFVQQDYPGYQVRDRLWKIVTDVPIDDEFGIEIDLIRLKNSTSDAVAVGCRNPSAGTNTRMFLGGWNGAFYWGWNTLTTYSGLATGTHYKQGLNFLNSRNMTLNDVVINSNLPRLADMGGSVFVLPQYTTAPQQPNYPQSADPSYYAYGRVRLSHGTKVVADFIPVMLKGGRAVYYDKVTKTIPEPFGDPKYILYEYRGII